jgi:hypothetical protein
LTTITIDMREPESERSNLSTFLESKIHAQISMEDKKLVVDSGKEALSPRDVKTYVKRFLHSKGLSETYRVTEEHSVVRVTKREHEPNKKVKTKTPPNPHQTMPYYFP